MTENCYIHIPFCKSKCKYCSFTSYPYLDKITPYIYSLLKEISVNYKGEKLQTLYIGGGTPSLISPGLINIIIKNFSFAEHAEITIEVNPDDVTAAFAEQYLLYGINRISMGVQCFNDEILKEIGRRHTAESAVNAVRTLQYSGFDNISIDFIYGLPGQSLKNFIDDIKLAVQLPVKHISLYGLKIESQSYYYKKVPSNIPDDDVQADMYLAACDFLEKNGFKQYEISNFSKPGWQSRHNLNYWANNTYYGFGASAHGYVDGFRYYNVSNLEEYIQTPANGEYAHYVTEKEKLEEEIFLGLRKVEGINIENINDKFNINFLQEYSHIINKYASEYINFNNKTLSFTRKGFLLSNVILSEFL